MSINTYLQVLHESSGKPTGSIEGAEKATIKPLDKKVVDGVEEPVEVDAYTGVDMTTHEEKVKYNHMSKDNVFEQLYKRAINEDFDDENPMDSSLDDEGGEDMGFDGGEDEGEEMDADPGHIGKVREVIDLLQQALDVLSSFEGEEEEEYQEYEDGDSFGDEEDEDSFGDEGEAPVTEEETQFGAAKTIGHALVNRETFIKGQDKKGNMVVKNATNSKVSKKKANASYGKGINGKPSNFSDAGGKKMQGKGNMKVPGRASNVGKFAFED